MISAGRWMCALLGIIVIAVACSDDSGSDPLPTHTATTRNTNPIEAVVPEVDTEVIQVVDLAEVAAAVDLVTDFVPAGVVRPFMSATPVRIADVLAGSVACLNDQGKLEFRGYQDKEYLASVGLFFAVDTAGLGQFDSLVCAWEAFDFLIPLSQGLPDPIPPNPVLDPCFETRQYDTIAVVWVASTNWMCGEFAGNPVVAVCADGTVVPARRSCTPAVARFVAADDQLRLIASVLAQGFSARFRGADIEVVSGTVLAVCASDADLAFGYGQQRAFVQDLQECSERGVEVEVIHIGGAGGELVTAAAAANIFQDAAVWQTFREYLAENGFDDVALAGGLLLSPPEDLLPVG